MNKILAMKFNWGTGIFIFLILFLMAAAVFIIFAVRQDVNLVHKNYYEKGVDYSEQMNVISRSSEYKNAIEIVNLDKYLVVDIKEYLSLKIDSGQIVLYRPSDSKRDVIIPVEKQSSKITIPKNNLIHGRYILKFYWYHEGLKFELDKPVNIQ